MDMTCRRRFLASLLAGLLLASAAEPGFAKDGDSGHGGGGDDSGDHSGHGGGDDGGDDNSGHGNNDDGAADNGQARAREAERGGNIKKLRDVLRNVKAQYQGDVLDVNLRQLGAAYTYHVKLIDPAGRVFTVRVDAARGNILGLSKN
ncbi:hypothetical protein BH10PSE7_BH10PSE7_12910 [soil metagenome]